MLRFHHAVCRPINFRARLVYRSPEPGSPLLLHGYLSLGWEGVRRPDPNAGSLGYFVNQLQKYAIKIFRPSVRMEQRYFHRTDFLVNFNIFTKRKYRHVSIFRKIGGK